MTLRKYALPATLALGLGAGGLAWMLNNNDDSVRVDTDNGLKTEFTVQSGINDNAPDLLPNEADFEAYMANLKINAQGAPYNLDDNVFIITRTDMANIEATVRAELANVPTIDLIKPLLQGYEGILELVATEGIENLFDPQLLEQDRENLVLSYVLEHQSKFIEYAYLQAGYGSESQSALEFFQSFFDLSDVEPLTNEQVAYLEGLGLSDEDMQLLNIIVSIGANVAGNDNISSINDLSEERLVEFTAVSKQMADGFQQMFAPMNEGFLGQLIGQTLLSIETRSYAMAPGATGGVMEMMQPNAFANRTSDDGSVLVGDDGTQADGHLIQSALSLDPSKMHPAFSSLSYLPDFINLHEAGHHVMGIREELAEQYGALRYRQLNPETLGTLEMMRDFRNLHLIVNDHQLVPVLYGDTSISLRHVLSLSDKEITAIDSTNIIQAARQGHAPDEIDGPILQIDPDSMGGGFGFLDPTSMFNIDEIERQMKKFGAHQDTYALSVAFFEEYETIAPSLVSDYYLKTNRVSLFMADYFSRDDASLEGLQEAMRTTDVFALAQQAQNYDFEGSDQLDPAVLEQTVDNLLVRYEVGSTEYDLLTNAKTALRNFADPVNAYNLQPNFEAQPGWDAPLLDIGYNPVFGNVDYDAFGWITWELENIERSLNPDLSSPNLGPGSLFPGQGGFSTQDTIDAMRDDPGGFGTHQGSPMPVDPLEHLKDQTIGPSDIEDDRLDLPTTRELLDGLGHKMFDGADDNVGPVPETLEFQ